MHTFFFFGFFRSYIHLWPQSENKVGISRTKKKDYTYLNEFGSSRHVLIHVKGKYSDLSVSTPNKKNTLEK